MTLGDLVNKGFILNHPSGEPGRTFIVTGLHRSGTSLVASILYHARLFIGSEFNSAIYEDEEITQSLVAKRLDVLQNIIEQRNATHTRWGFKCPMLCDFLEPHHLNLFDRPRLIIAFRDPVAIAMRTSLSEYPAADADVARHDDPAGGTGGLFRSGHMLKSAAELREGAGLPA